MKPIEKLQEIYPPGVEFPTRKARNWLRLWGFACNGRTVVGWMLSAIRKGIAVWSGKNWMFKEQKQS